MMRIITFDLVKCRPLAGPVVAAACVVPLDVHIDGIHDSKLLNETQREALYEALVSHPKVQYKIVALDQDVIDEMNILAVRRRFFTLSARLNALCLQATMRAMAEAVAGLPDAPDFVYVDGNRLPEV